MPRCVMIVMTTMLSKKEHKEALDKFLAAMGIETVIMVYRYKDDLVGKLEGTEAELKAMAGYINSQVDAI